MKYKVGLFFKNGDIMCYVCDGLSITDEHVRLLDVSFDEMNGKAVTSTIEFKKKESIENVIMDGVSIYKYKPKPVVENF